MQTTKETNGPVASGAPPIVLCTHPDCTEPAAFAYVWAWGEKGYCCTHHHFLLNQTAQQIERTVQFYPIAEHAHPAVERPERVALTARALAAEAECEESKTKYLELYRQNVSLAGQVQTLSTRVTAAQAAEKHAQQAASQLDAKVGGLQQENAQLLEEVERLRMITGIGAPGETLSLVAGADERTSKGLAPEADETTEVSGKGSKKK